MRKDKSNQKRREMEDSEGDEEKKKEMGGFYSALLPE